MTVRRMTFASWRFPPSHPRRWGIEVGARSIAIRAGRRRWSLAR